MVTALGQLDEVVTPALVVDRNRLLTNIQEMAARARSLGIALRPHAKTHKSPAIAGLQRKHGAMWEVDCGVGRFGTPPGRATADLVAQVAGGTTHASFDGLLAFGGHAYAATSRDGIVAAAHDEHEAMVETARVLADRGIETAVRSVGSTPTSHFMESADGITEMRPGNYVFHDATQVALGVVPLERCALSVLATVTSRPARDRLILDSGSKALAAERLTTLTPGFGVVEGHPELKVERLYEEQAIVHIDGPCELQVGARVRVVPNHACAAANLHSRMSVVEDGTVVEEWPVATREWSEVDADRRPAWS